ncbi:MAG: hypothetical protein BECKG1743E_GA0114224_110582, partial [Candidatus Kentron sp. G]
GKKLHEFRTLRRCSYLAALKCQHCLVALIERNISEVVEALASARFIELSRGELTIHE